MPEIKNNFASLERSFTNLSQDMEFGMVNCAIATFKRCKLTKVDNKVFNERIVLRNIDANDSYKYLGIHESDGIHIKQ